MKKLSVLCLLVVAVMTVPVAYGYQGTATCKWVAPTTFSDGSVLVPAVDLASFRVKCGQVSGGPYPTVVTVPGGSSTQVTVPIPVGTTYCVVTAVTVSAYGGLESANSVEGSKTITVPSSGACKTFTME